MLHTSAVKKQHCEVINSNIAKVRRASDALKENGVKGRNWADGELSLQPVIPLVSLLTPQELRLSRSGVQIHV
ncbi:hypothetical protein DPMN_011705 [Dreissena polymorpha]|uniref:Uncharacterized protein n=1 Tax=Dreissena polymorpha TaxID=45954 RepID=A0A9D4S2Q5_DREPO|nr:hypothetical protein DPMN_011705 [Dreissena polymorpha]